MPLLGKKPDPKEQVSVWVWNPSLDLDQCVVVVQHSVFSLPALGLGLGVWVLIKGCPIQGTTEKHNHLPVASSGPECQLWSCPSVDPPFMQHCSGTW